jgi:ankyrin repeat protein
VWLLVMVPGVASAAPDTRLIDAVKRRDPAAVKQLIGQSADVNARQGDGSRALHWAAHADDRELVDLLLRAGADPNAANDLGVTPLILSCTNGGTAVAKRLVEAGADPNLAPAGRETPLMIAAWTGSLDIAKLLVSRGADVNAAEPTRKQTALMWAVSEGHPDLVRLLVENGADLHARTLSNQPARRPATGPRPATAAAAHTPLLFAARVGDVHSARILLDAGAKVDDTADDGLSALVLATVRGHVPLATLLLERGANPNAAEGGFAALHWAAGSWETTLTATDITTTREGNGEWNALAGLTSGRLELVKALLARGADPNLRMKTTPTRAGASRNTLPELVGATPYLLAAVAGEPEVMRALVDAGANVSLTTDSGSTPLMAAAGFGRILGENTRSEPKLLQAAKLAVELGASVQATDTFGNTALHYAAYHRLSTVVQFLVDKGAPLEAQNKFGETPLWLSQLAIQFFGGGTYQILRSGTSDLLRKLGAVETKPSYDRARPRDWPDNSL